MRIKLAAAVLIQVNEPQPAPAVHWCDRPACDNAGGRQIPGF
jgi:hypothetical protein